jgi:hypothetical protein
LREIAEAIGVSEEIKADVAYISQYYSFMTKMLDMLVRLYDRYPIVKAGYNDYLKLIWLIICYIKKTTLKRRSDNQELQLLICLLLDEVRIYLKAEVGSYREYLKALGINDKDLETKATYLRSSIKTLLESLDKPFDPINLEAGYSKLKDRYFEVLIPDELDDIIIFQTHMKQKKHESNSMSPFKTVPVKEPYEGFIKSLDNYANLDISYLSIKIHKNNYCDFTYKELYEEFEANYLIKYQICNLQKITYNKHKSMFLKLNEEYLTKNQNKVTEKQFHRNFLIISFYVYSYLLNVEDKTALNNFIYIYGKHLNKYPDFEVNSVILILISLNDTSIPSNIKLILKCFYNMLLTSVIWQIDSTFVKAVINKEIFSNELKVIYS